MWEVMRFVAVLGVIGAVIVALGLAMAVVVAFQYGINHENGLAFGLIGVGMLMGILKRRDIIWLLRFGLTGDRRRGKD